METKATPCGKRLIAYLLTIILIVGMLPISAGAASQGDLQDMLTAQIQYYKINTMWAPLTALGVYALTRDIELGGVEFNTSYTGTNAYSGVRMTGCIDAVAAIDSMALGLNPRRYYKLSNGILEQTPTDLISELLNSLQSDGTFKQTTTQAPPNTHSTSLYAILALEMFYGGRNWARAGGNEKQTRVGAIEAFLECFTDAKYVHATNGWEIENGRLLAPIGAANALMANRMPAQLDAALLLSRWLEDETLVSVNGEPQQALKVIAAKELNGLLKSFKGLYNGEGASGKLSTLQDAIKNRANLPIYISVLIAAGQKEQVDELGLMDTLLSWFATEEDVATYDKVKASDLGGYLDRANNNTSPYVNVSTVFRGTIALGDYLHNESVYKTLTYSPELGESEIVSWDIEELSIPTSVDNNIVLPTVGRYGSTISWTSSNENVINSSNGTVTRPPAGQNDVVVRLRATVSYGKYSKTKDFVVTVISMGRSDKAIANADANTISLPLFTTKDIELPVEGKNGSTITWVSSDPTVISENGNVTCASTEKKVILTATIVCGNASVSRDFEITIGKIVDQEDIVTQAVYKIRESYNENRNLTQNYWAVWMAKSVLRDDFDKYNFSVYNVKTHKAGRNWAGTDWGSVVLQIVAQGDNPYNYQGYNYVQGMLDYIYRYGDEPNWGGFAEPIFLAMGLDAAGAMTPELQKSALETLSGMMRSLKSGPDYGGWAMVPVSNYIYNTGDRTYVESFNTFRQLCLDALEKTPSHPQYGFIGGEPYAGYSAAAGSNCVLIGSVGAMRAGIEGFDLQQGDWVQADGKTNIVSQIYESAFKNKNAPYAQQQSIAFADLYHGSNVWVSENPSPAKLNALLDTAEDVLKNAATQYSEKSILALQAAYENAKSYKDSKYNFGKAYFDLRDAIKGLQEANGILVNIIGNAERQIMLADYVVRTSGLSYLEILQAACIENGMTITVSDQEISEVDGLQAAPGSAWYVYDGQTRVTNLHHIPEEGAIITLKHCLDSQSIEETATLDEHLLLEAKAALDLGDLSAVTQDLMLPDTGLFGVAISWLSDKPANMTHDGRITRSGNDVRVLLTAKLLAPNGASTTKQFIAVVKGTQSSNPTEKAYAYISVKDPKGKTFFPKTAIQIEPGETAYTLLVKTGLNLEVSPHTQYGVYVEAIEGYGEFDDGPYSGWVCKVNGVGIGRSSALVPIHDGDVVEWLYTRDLGRDAGIIWDGDDSPRNGKGEPAVLSPKVTASNGTAAVAISVSDMNDAIAKAKENESTVITIAPEISGTAKKATINLPSESLMKAAEQTNADITVNTPVGSVTLPNSVLQSIAAQASDSTVTVSLAAVDPATLTAEQQKAIGEMSIYDISILSGNKNVSSFGGGSIIISLPYTLKDGEEASGVTVWYMDEAGRLHEIETSYSSGYATFVTTHLSYYLVGYAETWKNPFKDVTTGDWFYEYVEYAARNKLMTGTSDTTFEPNADITRAMLVTVLYRMEGKPAVTGTSAFTDVQSGQWYTDAIVWASANNIVRGYGNGLFGANDKVTREQLATILFNYARFKGYDVSASESLSNYSDANDVSVWAQEAVRWAVAKGIITGRTATTIVPLGNATRAEVAAILMRFAKNVAR